MLNEAKQCLKYVRRRPELSPCYKVIQEHLDTFIAEREAEGRPLPLYVIQEFEAFLKCGIPGYGFLRLKCRECTNEKIVAFSGKKRGFCPSCCAKRMMEASTHLVDNVLPLVPYRQFVVTLPIPLRYWCHFNKKLYAKIHKLIITEIHQYYIDKAIQSGIKDPSPGSMSFTQRWGSALNLNPHIHCLCPDGVYTWLKDKPRFHKLNTISNDDVAILIQKISLRVIKYLKTKGYIDQDGDVIEGPHPDDLFQDYDALTQASTCSISNKIAFGPNAGKYVQRLGASLQVGRVIALAKGNRCYAIHGFSLHANTAIRTYQRDRLEKLIQYLARGPLANDRLELLENKQIKLRLKRPFSDGTTHLLFSYGEFLEKLMTLIPPPRSHLVRWAGCFAPNSPLRKAITLKPQVKKAFQFKNDTEENTLKNYSWSKMLARAFKIDVTQCEQCGGNMRAVSSIMERMSIIRYLKAAGIDYEIPARGPPKYIDVSLDFETNQLNAFDEPTIYLD